MIVNNFVREIENLCQTKNVDYIDAVVMYAEKHNIEMETVAVWIKKDPTLKSKIQAEAENINVLKRRATLF